MASSIAGPIIGPSPAVELAPAAAGCVSRNSQTRTYPDPPAEPSMKTSVASFLFDSVVFIAIFFCASFYWKTVLASLLSLLLYCIFFFPERLRHSILVTPLNPIGQQYCVLDGIFFPLEWIRFCVLGLLKHPNSLDQPHGERNRSFSTTLLRMFGKGLGLFLLLSWCLCLSPLHIITPTLLDLWTKYEDHPPLESFNTVYDAGETSEVQIFAVHGLGSNPSSAWKYHGNGTDVYWLEDILPKQKGLKHIRITMLNHQTRWDSHVPDLDLSVYAKTMLDDIEDINQGNLPMVFIAHSFGGLLLKKALVLAMTRSKRSQLVAERTRGILFLGVPHYGTKSTLMASILSCTAYWRGSSTSLLEFMSGRSNAAIALDKEFRELYAPTNANFHTGKPYICNFLEARPERLGKLSLYPTVDYKSGNLPYAEYVVLDTDHRGLNKFRSSIDPNFKTFLRHFRRAVSYENERR